MMTQYAAAMRKRDIPNKVGGLAHHQDAITSAFDMLLTGY